MKLLKLGDNNCRISEKKRLYQSGWYSLFL